MGQLTNLYVSQSYQGLLKMTDSTNGLTNTLQTVQTGDGDNSPLQMSLTEVNISGSLTVNGSPVTAINTGSFATTGSNTFTGNQLITGSEGYVTVDGSTAGTNDNALFSIHANNDGPWIGRYFNDTFSTGSSILSFWGDNDGTFHFHNESTASIKFGVNNYGDNLILNNTNTISNRDLIVSGALYQTGTFYADQIDVSQGGIVQGTGSYVATFTNDGILEYATYPQIASVLIPDLTGSFNRNGLITTGSIGQSQTITGSLDISGTISANSASFNYLHTIYETASIIYSSGSNQLGDELSDNQILSGSVYVQGAFYINGVPITNGTSGTSGTSGSSGANGSSGSSGTAGSSGVSGSSGTSGTAGTSGSSGQAGSSGTSGSSGATGANGSSGTSGTSGSSGQSGSSGSSGSSGLAGSSGTSGTSGSSGATGANGSSGTSGTAGTSGSSGVAGSSGTSGTAGSSGTSPVFDSGSYATTGSNIFKGDQVVSGSLIGNSLNNGMIFINSEAYNSGSVKANISASAAISQSNIFFGGLTGPAAANQTGSIVVSGSNNILLGGPRPSTITSGTYGYINGNSNIMGGQQTLTTSSVIRPVTSNNINMGSLALAFTTSSLAAPNFSNGLIFGSATFNHQSGSSQANANLIAGTLTSTQNNIAGVNIATIAQNVINGTATLSHISSSILFTQNNINGTTTITDLFSGSFSNATNGPSVTQNTFIGNIGVWLSGSNSSASTRTIAYNIIGGLNSSVTSSLVNSNNGHLVASIVYGDTLRITGSHTSANSGGSAFFGRHNGTEPAVADAQNIVFAVGTGTGNFNKRTSFWIDSGSVSNVSGSLNITGALNINGVTSMTSSANTTLFVSGTMQTQRLQFVNNVFNTNVSSNLGAIRMSSDNQTFQYTNYDLAQITTQSFIDQIVNTGSAYTQTKLGARYGGTEASVNINNYGGTSRIIDVQADNTNITGSLIISGSAGDLTMYGHKMFNIGAFYDTTTQSGSANVSQSISYNTTDITKGVSVVSGTRLTVANAGTYNIQFSAQIDRVAGSGTDTAYIWLKKNGSNVVGSAGAITISGGALAAKTISSWNYVVDSAANDYYELVWQATDSNIQLIAATATGNIPSIPSIITTVTQVR